MNQPAPPICGLTGTEFAALPERVRGYIMNLETNTDPTGTVRESVALRERIAAFEATLARMADGRHDAIMVEFQRDELNHVYGQLDKLEAWFCSLPRDEKLHNHDVILEIVRDARSRMTSFDWITMHDLGVALRELAARIPAPSDEANHPESPDSCPPATPESQNR